MLVSHLRNASKTPCRCGSWLQHWAKFGGYTTLAICSASDCCKIATVGAHVEVGGRILVIPMCDRHHEQPYPVDVYEHTLGVSADESKTCARPSLAELGLSALSDMPMHRFQTPVHVATTLSGSDGDATTTEQAGEEIAGFLSGPIDRSKRHFGY